MLVDALLASEPAVSCDEAFERARGELGRFEGVEAADAPAGFKRYLESERVKWGKVVREAGIRPE